MSSTSKVYEKSNKTDEFNQLNENKISEEKLTGSPNHDATRKSSDQRKKLTASVVPNEGTVEQSRATSLVPESSPLGSLNRVLKNDVHLCSNASSGVAPLSSYSAASGSVSNRKSRGGSSGLFHSIYAPRVLIPNIPASQLYRHQFSLNPMLQQAGSFTFNGSSVKSQNLLPSSSSLASVALPNKTNGMSTSTVGGVNGCICPLGKASICEYTPHSGNLMQQRIIGQTMQNRARSSLNNAGSGTFFTLPGKRIPGYSENGLPSLSSYLHADPTKHFATRSPGLLMTPPTSTYNLPNHIPCLMGDETACSAVQTGSSQALLANYPTSLIPSTGLSLAQLETAAALAAAFSSSPFNKPGIGVTQLGPWTGPSFFAGQPMPSDETC
ncbi:unnamed protein product, partial [Protopolystoma xenopodis]